MKKLVLLAAALAGPGAFAALPIVVPAERGRTDETAARELKEYLGKITGETFSVVPETRSPQGPAIHLGRTARVKAEIADLDGFKEEEWTVRVRGGDLLLAGGGFRGTLYAVYHYLEDVCGVRWLTPVAEDVSAAAAVPMPSKDLRGRPEMPYRDIYVVPQESGTRFLARNRMQAGGADYGRGLIWGAWLTTHTLYTMLGDGEEVKRLFREHPDWFPLIDGRRWLHEEKPGSKAQSQLCLTNPELRRYWIGKMRERMRKDIAAAKAAGVETPRYWAIDQNDAFDGFCQCERCRAVIAREGSTSGLVLDFCNEVAAELEKEDPTTKFSMLAEHVLEKPPKFVKGRPNVVLRLCDTTSNMLYPWTDRDNAVQRRNLLSWTNSIAATIVWDYQITYVNCDLPIPTERTFASDIRLARDAKGEGFFLEHEHPVGADMRDLKVWLEIKLLENPDLDDRELVRDFTDRYYGPAAGALIRRYRDRLGAAADEMHPSLTYFPTLSAHAFITARYAAEFYGLREQALAAVKGDAERTARVEHAFLSLDRFYLLRSAALRRQAERLGPGTKLPAVAEVAERFPRIFDREARARGYEKDVTLGRKGAVDDLFTYLEKTRDLPVPARFGDVPRDDLFLFPATFSSTYYGAVTWADDPTTPAGKVLKVTPSYILKEPLRGKRLADYDWPLRTAVWPTMTGTPKGVLGDCPAEQPKGYHWYKVASDVLLKPDSVFAVWPGSFLPLDGVVCDNSEIGQKYDIWVSLKIEGKDLFKDGKADESTVYYLDQAAVVRKTRHQAK